MSRKKVKGNEGAYGKSSAAIFLTFGWFSRKENPLQVSLPLWCFCISFEITPLKHDLKYFNLGGCTQIGKIKLIGKRRPTYNQII